jgi:CheY-like chemotaxis protein
MPSRILVVDDSATIRRVVGSILERSGYEVTLAADGQAAFELLTGDDKQTVDLVLLDFVMPKMNGFQLCRMIRQREEIAQLPVVLMSAKSDKIRDQFVQQTGAIDAISKPFDAQALVAVIDHALRRVETGRASAVHLPEDDDEEPSGPAASDEEMRRARVATAVMAQLARLVVPAAVRAGAAPEPDEITRDIEEGLDEDALRGLKDALAPLDDAGTGPVLTGEFGMLPLGAILQLLQVEGQSGELKVQAGASHVVITMRGGLIDLVQSRGTTDEFRIGRFFVEEGLVSPADLAGFVVKERTRSSEPVPPMSGKFDRATARTFLADAALRDADRPTPVGGVDAVVGVTADTSPEGIRSSELEPETMRLGPGEAAELIRKAEADATASGKVAPTSPDGVPSATPRLLGDRLLAAGRINEEQLRAALVRQSSELVYELLRWPKGRFEFRRRPPAGAAAAAKLGLTVPAVVMEGFRRVDEWRGLEGAVGDFEGVLVQDSFAIASLPGDKLTPKERTVLDAVDGERTLREVIAASHMSSFDACRVLAELLAARLVRRHAG